MHALRSVALAGLFAILVPTEAPAVSLDPDGMGQALVYPYYTTNVAAGNLLVTYFQVKNHSGDAKALRVRFREGRQAVAVLDINLYLGPHDTWTGAVVPDGSPDAGTAAAIITADTSCTDPVLPPRGEPFRTTGFSGVAAGAGDEPERTREGFIEVLEMATLTGASAQAATHEISGVPSNCGALRAGVPSLAPPTGGLSGNVTIINVNTGYSLPVDAMALADLASAPYFRAASDPYPGFTAAEIEPVSIVEDGGYVYRSMWARPLDAVSAVLMRKEWRGEFVLDRAVRALTDMVVTLPTRHLHLASTAGTMPFEASTSWAPTCVIDQHPVGHRITNRWWDRLTREKQLFYECDWGRGICTPPPRMICASAAVAPVANEDGYDDYGLPRAVSFLGSKTLGLDNGELPVYPTVQNGWFEHRSAVPAALTSLPSSIRIDVNTGSVAAGSHRFEGLPLVGFTAYVFTNGTLTCEQGTCMGTYGATSPLTYRRGITLVP